MPHNMLLGVMPHNISAKGVVEDDDLTKTTTYPSTLLRLGGNGNIVIFSAS